MREEMLDEEESSNENEGGNSLDQSVPFSVLMQQACTLKSKQNEIFRRKYDSWPSWLQHSMFSNEEIIHVRSLPYSEKIQSALAYKTKGNDALVKEEYYEAIHSYENSMSIFHWIINKKENWKKQEIEDDMIEMGEYFPMNSEEKREINELKVSCLLNIALASIKLNQWSDCIKACTGALEIDSTSVKAYYRRAQARLFPIQCGATETEMALEDLKKAYELSPNDPVIIKLYLQVKKDIEKQQKKDLQTFGGLFQRGTIIQSNERHRGLTSSSSSHPDSGTGNGNSQETMTIGEALRRIKDMESTSKSLYRDGKISESHEMEEKAILLKKEIQEYQESILRKQKSDDWLHVDYSNPTPETIESATKMGLDLTDPRVVSYLTEVQKDLLSKKGSGAQPDMVMESIETIHYNQMKETATFICDGWDVTELNLLAGYRLKYHSQSTTAGEITNETEPRTGTKTGTGTGTKTGEAAVNQSSHPLNSWNTLSDLNSKRQLLIQTMTSDLLEIETHDQQEDKTLVIQMLNERYGLKELEKEQKLKLETAKSTRYWLTFLLSGVVFFCLLFIPAYMNTCQRICSQPNDCTPVFSFCFIYFQFMTSFSSSYDSILPEDGTTTAGATTAVAGDVTGVVNDSYQYL